MPLDVHTLNALCAVADDLSLAARRAIERAADVDDGDPIGRALRIYDALNTAISEVARCTRADALI